MQPVLSLAPLGDFGELQARYQGLQLTKRALSVLKDAGPALQAIDKILEELTKNPKTKQAFVNIRKNQLITGKMRASEAKNLLMESDGDFIEATCHKLAAWRKTMERIGAGEDVVKDKGKERIPATAPVALAIIGSFGVSGHLSVIQLVLGELGKLDTPKAEHYASCIALVRRGSTTLSDCELASGISALAQ